MGMSNAEKQAAYRARKLKDGDGERIQVIVNLQAKRALERLAKHAGMTQAALLESLLMRENERVTAGMDGDQFRVYVGEQ